MNEDFLRLPQGVIGPVKMVFLDLDGTTLDPNKRMTPATAEALHLLKSQGIPFTFASARPAAMMTLHCQKAGLTGPIIAMEGADLRIWETGSTIRHFPIEEDTALELMEFCHNSGLDYTFYTPHAAHFRQSSQRLPRFRRYNDLAVAAGLPPVSCQFYEAYDPHFLAAQKVLKVCVNVPDGAARAKVDAFIRRFPSLRAEGSEGSLVSIVSAQVSKAAAVALVCQLMGIDLKDVCCFGDFYNDMEMLSQAGWSVAMGNAPEAVRQSAKFVTYSNTEDGVAYFIRHHLCTEVKTPD